MWGAPDNRNAVPHLRVIIGVGAPGFVVVVAARGVVVLDRPGLALVVGALQSTTPDVVVGQVDTHFEDIWMIEVIVYDEAVLAVVVHRAARADGPRRIRNSPPTKISARFARCIVPSTPWSERRVRQEIWSASNAASVKSFVCAPRDHRGASRRRAARWSGQGGQGGEEHDAGAGVGGRPGATSPRRPRGRSGRPGWRGSPGRSGWSSASPSGSR